MAAGRRTVGGASSCRLRRANILGFAVTNPPIDRATDRTAFCMGGVELALACDRADVVDGLLGGWRGYPSSGAAPDVLFDYQAIAGWHIPQPKARDYPGYECDVTPTGAHRFARADSRGRLNPVVGTDCLPLRGSRRAARARRDAAPRALRRRAARRRALDSLRGGFSSAETSTTPGRALLFSGPSGAGKSTVSRLLEEALPLIIASATT